MRIGSKQARIIDKGKAKLGSRVRSRIGMDGISFRNHKKDGVQDRNFEPLVSVGLVWEEANTRKEKKKRSRRRERIG